MSQVHQQTQKQNAQLSDLIAAVDNGNEWAQHTDNLVQNLLAEIRSLKTWIVAMAVLYIVGIAAALISSMVRMGSGGR